MKFKLSPRLGLLFWLFACLTTLCFGAVSLINLGPTKPQVTGVLAVANGGTALSAAPTIENTYITAGCNNATAAPAWDLPTSGAVTASCSGTTSTQGQLDYVDAATTGANTHFRLPTGWTGNVDIVLVWWANAASSNAVRWSVATGCVADSEAVNTGPSYNTASASNESYLGTANWRKTSTLTSVAVTNCAATETMYVQVQRIGANAGDTLTATAELLEVTVIIRKTPQA